MNNQKAKKTKEASGKSLKLTAKAKKLRKKWIAALESGNYKQGTEHLRNRNSQGKLEYCCLGLLCNIIDPTKWEEKKEWWSSRECYTYGGFTRPEDVGRPPTQITDLVGLTYKQVDKLIRLNDDYRLTFKEIAGRIKIGNINNS